jgi:cell wall-associated NlpC family hydrolase
MTGIRARATTVAVVLLLAGLVLGGCTRERRGGAGHETPSVVPATSDAGRDQSTPTITVVHLSDAVMEQAAASGTTIRAVLAAAKPTIGTPYKWGASDLATGIDCSNYTWRLYRSIGVPYERYLRTWRLASVQRNAGFHQVTFAEARPGDLLVYGYRDGNREWHGHVVILVDRTGHLTGHRGLMLGAHGAPVSAVRFVTTAGFEEGWFREPEMRLVNVLRPVEVGGVR